MYNYIVYKCDTCQREIEHEQDSLRPSINKCNITFRCEGKLIKIGEKNIRSKFKTPAESNVIDWVPRGTVTELKKRSLLGAAPPNISLLTGEQILTIGLQNSIVPPIANLHPPTLVFKFKVIADTSNEFIEFTYQVNSPPQVEISTGIYATVIQGPDSSTQHKILRYLSSDKIKVYIDGVEKEEDVSFTININYPNSVLLSEPLVGTKTIKIYVYKQIEQETVQINFTADETTGSWGNIKQVNQNGSIYNLYHSPEIANLPANKYLLVDSIFDSAHPTVDLKQYIIVLLALDPWTHVDRQHESILDPTILGQLGVYIETKGINLRVMESVGLKSLFPLLSIVEPQWSPDIIPTKYGVIASTTHEPIIHSFIIGPS